MVLREYNFQIQQTHVQLQSGSFLDIETDALISPSNAYFSPSSGVTGQIYQEAGECVRAAVLKFALPLSAGSIIVTNAGILKAKYILHVAVLDFAEHHEPYVLIHRMVWDVLRLATSLHAKKIVIPLLFKQIETQESTSTPQFVTQISEIPLETAIDFLLRCLACYISTKTCFIHDITIVINSFDEQLSNLNAINDITHIQDKIEVWDKGTENINARLSHLIPLSRLTGDDEDIRDMVEQATHIERQKLHQIFVGSDERSVLLTSYDHDETSSLSQTERKHRVNDIKPVIEEFDEEIAFKKKYVAMLRRRLHILELKRAAEGIDIPPEVEIEIENTQAEIEIEDTQAQMDEAKAAIPQHQIQIDQLQQHRSAAKRDLIHLQSGITTQDNQREERSKL